jgi:two-component system, LuxR family, sensor kinase FixL
VGSYAQELSDYYADLYASVPVACLALDARGRIEAINLAGAALLGWERSWLLGQPFSRWVVKDDVDRFAEHLCSARRSQGKVVDDLRIKDRHGRAIDVRLASVAGGGPPGAAVCQTALIDITEAGRAARKARLLQAELAHVSRLNLVGELASSLAHELNQPLGTVELYCDTCLRMLRSGELDEPELIAALERASVAAHYAGDIIRHLRGFLRKDDEHRSIVDLNALIKETVRLIEADAREKGCAIRLDLAEDLPRTTVDPVHIEQVLLNLIRNAVEAMDGAGAGVRRITISTRRSDDDQLQVSVGDTGPGLSAKDFGRAFEPFYTTKPSGMGMGLAISRSIIEAQVGRLWAEHGREDGATFCFTLPVTKIRPAQSATVFVVDDDQPYLGALVLALRSTGLAVESFMSARDFLKAYDPDRSGCLVLDVRMPEMTGLELQQTLNARGIRIPIVFITGHGDMAMSVTAFRHGAVDFLEKPFSDQALLYCVQQALARDARSRQIEGDRALVMERFTHLTPREREIMALVVSDKSAKEIAARLKISPRTVEHHREHVMAKMSAGSLHDLIIMAVICGVHELRL